MKALPPLGLSESSTSSQPVRIGRGDAPTQTDGEENLHHTGPDPIFYIHPA